MPDEKTGDNLTGGNTPPATPQATQDPKDTKYDDVLKEMDKLRHQAEEAQRTITDLSTAKSTLEQRISQIESVPASNDPRSAVNPLDAEIQTVVGMSETDPSAAIRQMGRLIKQASTDAEMRVSGKVRNEMISMMNTQAYLKESKERLVKEDLTQFENEIAAVAKSKMNDQRMPLQKAVDETITEFKIKRDLLVSQHKKPDEVPAVPQGAKAESGTNPPPPPSILPDVEQSRSDYISERENKRFKRIYGLK